MQVANEKVVSIDYTLTNDEGTVLDASKAGEPLAYIHGTGTIIPGLESALEGKSAGDAFAVTVAPNQAYGERDEALLQEVSREVFASVPEIEVGMRFQAKSETGTRVITVTAIEGEKVTVDGNHPLAGVTLNFDVKVVAVREATPEELQHGHAHGAGGHGH